MANSQRDTSSSRSEKIEQNRDTIEELANSDLPLNWVAEALLREVERDNGRQGGEGA